MGSLENRLTIAAVFSGSDDLRKITGTEALKTNVDGGLAPSPDGKLFIVMPMKLPFWTCKLPLRCLGNLLHTARVASQPRVHCHASSDAATLARSLPIPTRLCLLLRPTQISASSVCPVPSQHCSGSDTLIGAAPMWLSVIILLLIGFTVGCISGVMAALHRQRKMIRHTGPETPINTDDEVHFSRQQTSSRCSQNRCNLIRPRDICSQMWHPAYYTTAHMTKAMLSIKLH